MKIQRAIMHNPKVVERVKVHIMTESECLIKLLRLHTVKIPGQN